MHVICSDLEGVFVPEIWINVAERTGIHELRLTTRDISDYDVLMKRRLSILDANGLKLKDITDVIATMDPLPGARQFLDWLRAMQASEVRVWIREINEEILRFFLKRGFVESRRTSQLLLAVQEVDLASFEPFVEQVSAQGTQIVSLEEEVSRGVDALRTWYDMVQADESQGRTYVEFLEQGVLRWMVPGSCFFARLQDQYVGYSSLYLPYVYPGTEADPGLLEQGYVRVRPPFRNRGIATALAAHVIGFAKRRNYCTIRADVAVTNAPSLAVKAKLGYRQVGGEIWVRKSPV